MIDTVCKDIIGRLKVNCFIETGTDKGETVAQVSRWFAQLHPGFGCVSDNIKTGARSYSFDSPLINYPIFSQVKDNKYQILTADIDAYAYESNKKIFASNPNIHLHHGSSEKFLKDILANDVSFNASGKRYFFYLDAHWGKYLPLRDELKAIGQLERYLVVIDDFFVPGYSQGSKPYGNFGFDIYQGAVLSWSYISSALPLQGVKVFYPNRCGRDKRGWILIARGYRDEELSFLKDLGFFSLAVNDPRHTVPVTLSLRSYLNSRSIIKMCVPMPLLRLAFRYYEACGGLIGGRSKSGQRLVTT